MQEEFRQGFIMTEEIMTGKASWDTPSQGREGGVKAEGVLPVMQWKGGIVANAIWYKLKTDIKQVNVALWVARQASTRFIHGSTLSPI